MGNQKKFKLPILSLIVIGIILLIIYVVSPQAQTITWVEKDQREIPTNSISLLDFYPVI